MAAQEVPIKKVIVFATFEYWLLSLMMFTFFLAFATYTICKLNRMLDCSNKYVIAAFSTAMLCKLAISSVIFFVITKQGNLLVFKDFQQLNSALGLTYYFAFIGNVINFLVNLIFYSIIISLVSLWDKI